MPISKPALFALASLLSLGCLSAFAQEALPPVDPAIATMTVDQKVDARQKAMKEDGRLLKAAPGLTGDEAVKTATEILQNFTNFPALFADGANNTISEASSDIWKEFDQFTALFTKGQGDAQALLAAAKSGDTTAYNASLENLKKVCGECHQRYRID